MDTEPTAVLRVRPLHTFIALTQLGALYAIRENKLDVKVQETISRQVPSEFATEFPLKQIPFFIGEDGFKLTESVAVAVYRKCPDWFW